MHRTQTLRRLGVAGLGAATLLSTPWIGSVGTALADPATVTIESQTTDTGSTRNDGTNTTVKISASVTPPTTNADATVSGVRFSYQAATGGPVVIGTDSTAPYSIEWTPPAAGTFTEIAEALDSSNSVIDADQNLVTIGDFSSVHITAPTDGSSIGSFHDMIVVSGTRSSDLPDITVTTKTRDNSNGAQTGATDPLDSVVTIPDDSTTATSQHWTAQVPVSPCDALEGATSCDVIIDAVADGGAAGTSDEVVQAHLYEQTVNTFTVTPSGQTQQVNVPATYTVTAADQFGKPVAGLGYTISDSDTSLTENKASGTTGPDGKDTFTAQNSEVETASITVQSNISGSGFQAGTDFTRSVTLTTYAPTPTTLTLSADPDKDLYASQSEYTLSTGPNGTPVVDVCIVDQNGNGINSDTAPSNLVVTRTRTTTTGDTTTGPTTTTETPVADDAEGFENCFAIPHPAATGDFGSDTYNAYLENNGTPGFQSGSSDIAAGALTLDFAQLEIIDSGDTQAQQGHTATVTFTVQGADGTPFAGRKIDLTLSGTDATFPTSQPGGTTRTNSQAATCVTSAAGTCSATVDDPTAGSDSVTATDDITDDDLAQIATNVSDSVSIDFRTNPTTLNENNSFVNESTALYPTALGGNSSDTPGIPGVVVGTQYQLRDQNDEVLKNVSVSVHLDHGYFTSCPGSSEAETYEDCSFTPAPADGAAVGAPVNNGQTQTFKTDDNGLFEMYTSIGRDAAFDQDGMVDTHPTATLGGVTINLGNPSDSGGDFGDHPTWVTNEDGDWCCGGSNYENGPLNGTSVQFLAAPGNDLSDTTADNIDFLVVERDQFGNLVRDSNGFEGDSLTLTVTGPGEVSDSTPRASFIQDPEFFTLFNESSSHTAQNVTVTAHWNTNRTEWDVTGTGEDQVISTTSSNVERTDSFTSHFYEVDLAHLHYKYSLKPARIVLVQTTVSDKVTVTDQYLNPVSGLRVNVHRSGPGAVDVTACRTTNGNGDATYSFSSAQQGTSTVTLIVTDDFGGCDTAGGSANELSRSVRHVAFDGVPTIHVSEDHFNKPGNTVDVFGHTRAHALVQLFKKVAGTRHYVLVKSKRADANGDYSFTRTVNKTQRFKVRVDHLVNSVSRKVTVG